MQILELQKANLFTVLTQDELKAEGFVTVQHNLPLLRKMNRPFPHIVARQGNKIIAYALVMLQHLAPEIPALQEMFSRLSNLSYEGVPLSNQHYFIMGQVCISKAFRGKGVFAGLYEEMNRRMRHQYNFVITEINAENQRSLRAHAKVGFTKIHTYQNTEGQQWVIVLLSLGPKP